MGDGAARQASPYRFQVERDTLDGGCGRVGGPLFRYYPQPTPVGYVKILSNILWRGGIVQAPRSL
jgi:hypothetical protein